MTLSPGDIVKVEVSFAEASGHKERPALVLTAPDATGDFLIAPLTSVSGKLDTVAIAAAQMASGSLPAPSWVRANRVHTVNKTLVVKQYGALTKPALQAVLKILCPQIGCK